MRIRRGALKCIIGTGEGRGRGRGGGRKIGREEKEVSVAVTSSIVPGTCAYSAPRAFGRRRVHWRKERGRREEEKEAVEAKSDGSALRTVKRYAEEESEIGARAFKCVLNHVTLSRSTFNPYLNIIGSSSDYHCAAFNERNIHPRISCRINRMNGSIEKHTVLLWFFDKMIRVRIDLRCCMDWRWLIYELRWLRVNKDTKIYHVNSTCTISIRGCCIKMKAALQVSFYFARTYLMILCYNFTWLILN